MFNYEAIDKTPTVIQIKAIIKHMDENTKVEYSLNSMMDMQRPEPNKIILDLNNAHFGTFYEILFNDKGEIESFRETGSWIS